jgi:hypothetical protein
MWRSLPWLALAVARTAMAQAPAADAVTLVKEALAKLRSDDLPTVAWGAWSIASNKLETCVGELRAQLVAFARIGQARRDLALRAVLDALIQIDAAVPVEELEPFLDQRSVRTQAMVLLARCGDENCPALRRLFRAETDDSLVWVACGNLLAGRRDPEFLLDLLRYPVHLRVSVVEKGIVPERERSRATHWGWQDSGDPPLVTYRLGERGILIADGPLPVHAWREVRESRTSPKGRLAWSGQESVSSYRRLLRIWLGDMLRDSAPDRLLDHDQWVLCEWSGADALLVGVKERREEIARDHRALVDACVAAKVLDAAVAKDCVPSVELEIDDQRKDRTVPLPGIPEPERK